MADLNSYIEAQQATFQEELVEFLRIPSVSADPQRRDDIRRAADWVTGQLAGLGLAAERIDTAGHPLVYAESPPVPGKPIVLVYGHYDVQPADPLDEWTSPPFEPQVRDGNIYARGATDDKGQVLTHIKSVEAWLKTEGQLPLQVKFLIEGEEEVGSESLETFIAANQQRLACQCVVVSDTGQFAEGVPAITYGLRGIAYFELRLTGPKQDLHSGSFGGGVTNPAVTLSKLLASLVDPQGRIQVPHFYDDVVPLSDAEREQFRGLPFDEAEFQAQIGVTGVTGEAGFSTLERRWARPSYDVHGLWSGYQGDGAKTVLPARAGGKFSFRLVVDQDPAKIGENVRRFLAERIPAGIEWELIDLHGAKAVVVPLGSPYVQAASRAIAHGFGRPPVSIREGGSIPIVGTFHDQLKVDTLLLGWGLSDDNAHGPNEKFSLADFCRGTKASAQLWKELAAC